MWRSSAARQLALLVALLGLGLWLLQRQSTGPDPDALEPSQEAAPLAPDLWNGDLLFPSSVPVTVTPPDTEQRTEVAQDTAPVEAEDRGPCECTLIFELPADASPAERRSLVGREICLAYDAEHPLEDTEHWTGLIREDLTAPVSGLWEGDYELRWERPRRSGEPTGKQSPTGALAPFAPAHSIAVAVQKGRAAEAHVALVRGRSFTGKVVDEVGKPRRGVSVALMRLDPTTGFSSYQSFLAETGADGTFALRSLPAPMTALLIESRSAPSLYFRGRRLRELMASTGPVTIAMPSRAPARVRVLLPDGRPAVGFPLRVSQAHKFESEVETAITDGEGLAVLKSCPVNDAYAFGTAWSPANTENTERKSHTGNPNDSGGGAPLLSASMLRDESGKALAHQKKWSLHARIPAGKMRGAATIEVTLTSVPVVRGRLVGLGSFPRKVISVYLIKRRRYQPSMSPWIFGDRHSALAQVKWVRTATAAPSPTQPAATTGLATGRPTDGGSIDFEIESEEGEYVAVASFNVAPGGLAVTNAVPIHVTREGADVVLRFPAHGRATGIVKGPKGQPIPEAKVRAYRQPEEPASGLAQRPFSAFTDRDGQFLFKSLPPATYRIEVLADGWIQRAIPNVVIGEGAENLWTLTMEPAGRLLVHLLGSDLPAGRDAEVVLTGPEGEHLKVESSPLGGDGLTLKFLSVPPGQIMVSAHFGKPWAWHKAAAFVTTHATTEVTLEAASSPLVDGYGRISSGGNPARGYTVTMGPVDRPTGGAVTDHRGEYRVANLFPGTYSLRVTSPGGKSPVFEARVRIGSTATKLPDITLEDASIRGYFSEDSPGYDSHGIDVALVRPDWKSGSAPFRYACASWNEEFMFRNLPAGRYRLVGMRDGGEARGSTGPLLRPVTVDVAKGQSIDNVELVVRPDR